MKLSKLIQEELVKRNLKQKEAAELGYISRATLSKIVNDKYLTSVKNMPTRIMKGLERTFGKELSLKGIDDYEWKEGIIISIDNNVLTTQSSLQGKVDLNSIIALIYEYIDILSSHLQKEVISKNAEEDIVLFNQFKEKLFCFLNRLNNSKEDQKDFFRIIIKFLWNWLNNEYEKSTNTFTEKEKEILLEFRNDIEEELDFNLENKHFNEFKRSREYYLACPTKKEEEWLQDIKFEDGQIPTTKTYVDLLYAYREAFESSHKQKLPNHNNNPES